MNARLLQQLMGLSSLDQADVGTLGQLQALQSEQQMQPEAQRAAQLQNEATAAQISMLPQEQRMREYRSVGDLANGLAYGAPQISSTVLQHILQQMGLYQPDPNAALQSRFPGTNVSDLLKIQQMQQHGH